jgi:hypothetical protein
MGLGVWVGARLFRRSAAAPFEPKHARARNARCQRSRI